MTETAIDIKTHHLVKQPCNCRKQSMKSSISTTPANPCHCTKIPEHITVNTWQPLLLQAQLSASIRACVTEDVITGSLFKLRKATLCIRNCTDHSWKSSSKCTACSFRIPIHTAIEITEFKLKHKCCSIAYQSERGLCTYITSSTQQMHFQHLTLTFSTPHQDSKILPAILSHYRVTPNPVQGMFVSLCANNLQPEYCSINTHLFPEF